jgi:hypothetical protein
MGNLSRGARKDVKGASQFLFSVRRISFNVAESIGVDNLYFHGIKKSGMLPLIFDSSILSALQE